MNAELTAKAHFDKNLVYCNGSSVRYLVVELSAPKVERKRERPALNLALVIDASGSMQGKPLDFAKEAACGVIRGLTERDVLSVISFSQDVIVHIDGIKLDKAGKDSAINAIQQLNTRGNTNLSAGWLKGAECVAVASEGRHGYHNHVIVLSDGWANDGICDPATLQTHAEGLRLRGVYTSAVGIGAEYSPTQMEALANFGGGQLHDVQYPPEIVEVVLGELGELADLYADDLVVTVSFSGDAKVSMLSPYPTKYKPGKVVGSLGSLISGATRLAIFRVTMSKGRIADVMDFGIDVAWRSPGDGQPMSIPTCEATLTFADAEKNSGQPRNIEATISAARVWQADIVKQSVEMNRTGNFHVLTKFLDEEIKHFARLVYGIDSARYLLDELKTLRGASERSWSESSRKHIYNQNYKMAKQETEHRQSQEATAPWWTHLTGE